MKRVAILSKVTLAPGIQINVSITKKDDGHWASFYFQGRCRQVFALGKVSDVKAEVEYICRKVVHGEML
jgi:hypothetical protein